MAASFRSPAKIARRTKVLPAAARELETWPRFMRNYALGLVPDRPYRFRNGAQLKIGRGVDHAPIVEVFFNRDYGPVPDGSVILDIGASIGVFSVYAAALAPRARIYAYEPSPSAFTVMEDNIRLNGLEDRVTTFNCAVADSSGERDLYLSGDGLYFPTLLEREAEANDRVRVPCMTLTEVLAANHLTRVNILKLDVEGAEYGLLRSTPTAELGKIDEIRMEAHDLDDEGCNVDALGSFLTSRGFEITHRRATSPRVHNVWARRAESETA